MRWLLVTGILILTSFLPMTSHAESENHFEKGYFDRDGDGLDDRMDILIENNENLGVIVILHEKPTVEHFKQIENTKVEVSTLGQNMLFDLKYVISAEPSMSGYIALISAGVYAIEMPLEFLSKHEELDVKLRYIFTDFENKTGWNASDFFDILENKWNLAGMSEAIKEAQSKCLK